MLENRAGSSRQQTAATKTAGTTTSTFKALPGSGGAAAALRQITGNQNYGTPQGGPTGRTAAYFSALPVTPSSNTDPAPGTGNGDPLSVDGAQPAPAAPQMPTDEQWLAGDQQYQLGLASLLKQLTNYRSGVDKQRTSYDTDYRVGLKGLGWKDKDDDLENNYDAKTGAALADAGDWDWTDNNGAAGRGLNGQMNDFAARGLLQSTDYLKARDDFKRSLGDQFSQMASGRQRYQTDLTDQYNSYKDENGLDEKGNVIGGSAKQAQFDSLSRRAAQFSF